MLLNNKFWRWYIYILYKLRNNETIRETINGNYQTDKLCTINLKKTIVGTQKRNPYSNRRFIERIINTSEIIQIVYKMR